MNIKIGLQHYILAGLVLLTLSLLINFIPLIQIIIGLLLIDLLSTAYGQIISPDAGIVYKWIIGFIALICLLIIGGALLIYLLSVNTLSIAALWLLLFLIPIIIWRKQDTILELNIEKYSFDYKKIILPFIFIILSGFAFYFIIQGSTTDVIYSVWSNISNYLVYIYFALSILLLILINKAKGSVWGLYTGIFIFISTALGALLYKLGFGFDFHIHTATTTHIWEYGTISPKPLYYIGYYSLILNFKWLLGISLTFLNKFLVPIIFAGAIPSIIYYSLYTSFDFRKVIFKYLPLSLLLIPYSLFTFSTPQSLANALFIILIALSLIYSFKKDINIKVLWLASIAICFIHPITGVPAFLLTLFISLKEWRLSNYIIGKQRQILFGLIVTLGVFVLPILFFINSYLNGNSINWQLPALHLNLPHLNNYISFFDFIYNFTWLLPLIVIILTITGIIYIYRMKRMPQFFEYALLLLILCINYIWLKYFINFNFLIDYERLNYANRLKDLIFISALPFLFIPLSIFIDKVLNSRFLYKVFTVVLVSIILTSTFYLSYPRRDTYSYNKSLNTSANDFAIVKTIDDSTSEDYVVLANQAVAAAALNTFGFSKYYNTNIYYYPIPTSGPLYQIYLDAIYQRQTIDNILSSTSDLTGVNNIYLVVNNYWTNALSLIDSYKKTATNWQQLNDDYIFYYNLADNVSQ
ncbi:MAG: hypothetical protein ACKKL6_02165 [Candidatus Komeilibacteria bacterium]